MNKKTLRSLLQKSGAFALSAVLLLGAGCSAAGAPYSDAASQDSPATVWYAPGTQKIRPDLDKESYADVQMPQLSVQSGRYEYESAQIIMSAERDIGKYELSVSDLTLVSDQSVRYSAENIEVYLQKYINVTKVNESSPLSTIGLYPDALVPFDAAAEYGENTVEESSNQGIWVEFYVPEGQQSGTYTGSFTLTMDGYRQTVPVSLKVWDIDYAGNYTARSCFLINWTSLSYAELDSSQDMYDAYAQALLDYRLNPGLLMNDLDVADSEDMQYYAQKAFEFAQDERVTTVFMPYAIDNGRGDTYLVVDKTSDWIRNFVNVSLESYGTDQQLNLVGKTMLYFTFVDEPTMNTALIGRANIAQETFANIRRTVYNEYRTALEAEKASLTDDEYAFRKEVIDSILTIRNVLTGPHDSRFKGIEVYCPLVDEYDSEQNREEYAQDVEQWWYTAVGPRYPYPTYHIDDTNLLSARILSWMQADYGVVGNLYWATNLYNAYTSEEFLEDPYDYAMRYQGAGGANGDGFLFYPGNKYGIEGPVGSIRLQTIRDGMEEYEILRCIEDTYEEIAQKFKDAGSSAEVDFEKVYSLISENLYSGTSVYTTQTYFDQARALMASLAELTAIGGVVSSLEITSDSVVVQLALPDSCTVNYDGSKGEVVTSTPAEGYKLYTFTQPISDDANVFGCSVVQGDKTISFSMELGGQISTYTVEELTADITFGVEDATQATADNYVKANTVDDAADAGTNWLKLVLPEATTRLRQYMILGGEELMGEIGKQTQKIVIKIYNDRDSTGDDEGKYAYRLQFRYGDSVYYTEIRQDTLKSGYNEITIGNVFGYNWDETGPLSNIRLYFGETGSPACDDLYLIGIDIYFV